MCQPFLSYLFAVLYVVISRRLVFRATNNAEETFLLSYLFDVLHLLLDILYVVSKVSVERGYIYIFTMHGEEHEKQGKFAKNTKERKVELIRSPINQ